jgi:hypothetical protein
MKRFIKRLLIAVLHTAVKFLEARKVSTREKEEARRKAILTDVKRNMECKNISFSYSLFMGRSLGIYLSNKSIQVNTDGNVGLLLADTLYHEDRHYQQDLAGKLPEEDYIQPQDNFLEYRRQHCEKDARRYAYVKVCRNCTGPLYKRVWLYKAIFHPWKGVAYRLAPLESKLHKKFK